MGLLEKLHATTGLELYKLEQRYTRRRKTFASEAVYVDGEYVFHSGFGGGSGDSSSVGMGGVGDNVSATGSSSNTTISSISSKFRSSSGGASNGTGTAGSLRSKAASSAGTTAGAPSIFMSHV
ncbi:hypothetical protein L228DRAFT_239825 [Xylona heveae TC161]|uniref:Uncharacterized protein n=1 Tax=Xylona heveae (strain CBS 132557 / TC161) TaxID=1328760 RepID=A0A165G939_XYLHT|nr:hypothetical protein L228DRAFT_239825 [Xylona heveae TC161]KZF21895.1 hypothetical protein L228DRAFT_239825 [Xylona heveae TC161]